MQTKSVLGSFVIGLIVGGVLGGMFMYQSGYSSAQKEIRARLEQAGVVRTVPTETKSISGTVFSVAKGQFKVDVLTPFDPTAKERASTVYTVTWEDPEVLTREIDYKMIPKPNVPFNPVIEKKATMGDVVVGSKVTVESSVNIQGTSFVATRVVINK